MKFIYSKLNSRTAHPVHLDALVCEGDRDHPEVEGPNLDHLETHYWDSRLQGPEALALVGVAVQSSIGSSHDYVLVNPHQSHHLKH